MGDAGGQLRFGDYVLLDRLGTGGSGVVYRAWQLSLQRLVALKLLDGQTDDRDEDRFARESRTAARLSHPHIVPIYEVGEHEGRRYLAMKLVEGQALNHVVIQPRRAVELIWQAAGAIAYAHRNGVVHRDLKPHNLILERDEHLWVTDFGIARSMKGGSTLTATGSVMGTPAYMPPEQARGERCDERSDVYSLGATLYELLTGRPPFSGGDLLVVMSRVLSGEAIAPRKLNPKVDLDVETIVGKAMAKDPRRRYQSAAELADDLRRYLDNDPILARPPGLLRQSAKWIRRRPVVTLLVLFLLAAGLGTGLHLYSLERQLAETTVAEGNALGAAGQWEAARARYFEAARAFARLRVSSVAPDLGLLDAYHNAPPPLLVLQGHTGEVRGLAFLPDGKHALSAGSDGTLRLWDVPLGREIQTFRGHRGAVASVAISPDGNSAVSGGADGTVRTWRIDSGQEIARYDARGGGVLKVALSPDGQHALSRTQTGVVQLWDLVARVQQRQIEVSARRLVAVAFSPDGRHALTGRNREAQGGVINARASLWEVDSGAEVQTFSGFGAEIESIAFSPDGRRTLTAGYDRVVSVWDVASGRRLLALRGHRHGLTGATFSPKDRVIVSAGRDNSVKLWDADDGKLIRSFDTGGTVEALAVSPDGQFILTGGGDAHIRLWDLSVGQEARTFSGHESSVHAVDLSRDGRLAISGGTDRKVRVWDVAAGREIRSFSLGATVHAVSISPDGGKVVAVGSSALVGAWNLFSGSALPVFSGHKGAVRSVAFSPDGSRVLTGEEHGDIVLWSSRTGRVIHRWKTGDEVRAVAFTADGSQAVAASFDGQVRLLDTIKGGVLRSFVPEKPERIGAVAITRDGAFVAAGNDNKLVRLWNARTGAQVRLLTGHLGDVRSVRFSPDGTLVLTAGRDKTLRIWDRKTGRELHAFAGASDAIRTIAMRGDGQVALVGGEDGSMKLWDFSLVATHKVFEARLAELRPVLLQRPEDPTALATLGEYYAFRGVSTWASWLLRRSEAAGGQVSALVLGRSAWRQGDFRAARRELTRALERSEAPPEYLALVMKEMGSSDQVGRLSQLNLRDGRVRFPFLGVRVRSETVTGRGVGAAPHPVISRVFPESPAAHAGLRTGDLIVRIDDQAIVDDATLSAYLASRSAGSELSLTYMRGVSLHDTRATLTERPGQLWEPDAAKVRDGKSGFELQTLTSTLAISFGLDPDTQGAVVTSVGSLPPQVAAPRILVGDVIVKIEGRPIATAERAVAALAALPLDRWKTIDLVRPGPAR